MDTINIQIILDLSHVGEREANLAHEAKTAAINLRLESADFLPIGNAQAFALEVEDARLQKLVDAAFEGVKSNADQRSAYLTGLRQTDAAYLEVKGRCLQARAIMDQQEADATLHGLKARLFMATMMSLSAIAKL